MVKKLLEDLGLQEFENSAASDLALPKESAESLENVKWGYAMSGGDNLTKQKSKSTQLSNITFLPPILALHIKKRR